MEEEHALEVDEREIWLQDDQEDLLGVNDASLFYADFPSLPDFPCMSSSSSSSSTPALPVKTITCSTSSSSSTATSSSSAASWAVLKSDVEEDVENKKNHDYPVDAAAPPATLSSTASTEIPPPDHGLEDGGVIGEYCMDVMEPFGYMELLENDDFFDPASIFQNGEYPLSEYPQEEQKITQPEEHAEIVQQQQFPQQEQDEDQEIVINAGDDNNEEEIIQSGKNRSPPDNEMSNVFLEWLKSNKDSVVSANDLRSVKLNKATIECAAKRLGGGKEGTKQLLKLILEWVQTSHFQNRRRKEINDYNNNSAPSTNFLNQFQDPNPSSISNPSTCFNQSSSTWISPPPYGMTDPGTVIAAPPSFPMINGYVVDPYSTGAPNSTINGTQNPYPSANEYQMLESPHSWPLTHTHLHRAGPLAPPAPAFAASYGNQYPYQYVQGPGGDKLMRLGPSATKEARKKRMARQRRYLSHHRNQKHHGQQNHGEVDPLAFGRLGGDNGTCAVNPTNWVYWASLAGGAAPMAPMIPAEPRPSQPVLDRTAMQTQNYHQGRVSSSDQKRQGWKPEKNLRFLLQKVLKQSDVGSLGRIVLPKKEAETHLPELEARDGISIAMEDIGTSRVWNMRYRYWPNNKSRMYLLENTGDFVKSNGLQEGDFIVLYSDVKCGKFMIRGVKVRQAGAKTETKKAGKSQKNQQHGNASTTAGANGSPSSSPNTQQQKNEKSSKIR